MMFNGVEDFARIRDMVVGQAFLPAGSGDLPVASSFSKNFHQLFGCNLFKTLVIRFIG